MKIFDFTTFATAKDSFEYKLLGKKVALAAQSVGAARKTEFLVTFVSFDKGNEEKEILK